MTDSYRSRLRMTNVWRPNETLPLMSVAIHLNVVVLVRWNVSPGSRGPVESHSADWLLGRDPSVVYRITDGSLIHSNVTSIGPVENLGPVIRTRGSSSSRA